MSFLDSRRLDPLLLGSPLRRPGVALLVALTLAAMLTVAAATILAFLASLRPDVAGIFFTAMALSTVLSVAGWVIFRYLDRRERESPWLMAVAFLWGAFMSTGLALPVNGAILDGVARWVERHPIIVELLGPEAPTLLGAPIAGPLVEEVVSW